MSETEQPAPDQGREHTSGAEAPTVAEQQPAAEAPPAQPAPAPVAAPKRPPRTVRAWLAAAVAGALLLGGGLGGYFIGAANNDHGRPGFSRFGDRPDFRGGVPAPPGGGGHRQFNR